MSELTSIKQGEKKTLIITVRDASGQLVDLSGAGTTLYLGIKRKKTDTVLAIEKKNADFTKTSAAQGVVSVMLTETDTAVHGKFIGELRVTFNTDELDETIEKSTDFFLYIEQAVTTS